MFSKRCSTHTCPSAALKVKLNTVEPIRMKSTKQDKRDCVVQRLVEQLEAQATLQACHHQRAEGPHCAPFCRCGDTEKDGAQHEEISTSGGISTKVTC